MVDITEDSGFFQQLTAQQMNSDVSVRLLHDSTDGWSQLYLTDRHGKFRVLKVLKPEFRGNPLYEELLKKEFEIGYTLSHPGICEIYGFHESAELGNCIEMEWIDGDSLSDLIIRNHISKELAVKLFSQICSAVQYIHSRQIVHRDLKPSNIMVTHNGQNIKIIDFGLSDSDSFSILKAPAGTVNFAAPELLEGKECDHRIDIYSLGRILELLGIKCPRTVAKCVKANPKDRFSEPVKITDSLNHEIIYRKSVILSLSVILILAAICIMKNFNTPFIQPSVDSPDSVFTVETDSILPSDSSIIISEPDTEMIYSTELIDELFRQATDMVVSTEEQN
ncbi:MAG: serine/threonine protein kinase [Bacteroidaceae bacterium]|nr:serine/threonine protein kinase [Bacteroidaceae bacterium]